MGFSEIISKYQTGHIVELKVLKKLPDAHLVIFELEGVSARLHVTNLSNSPELSRKLFSIIVPGELITCVIIGFNQEKQYIELSIKPFRNLLEGSLSFSKCRSIIDARKKMRVELPNDIIQENRNQLDRIQGDLAKVDLTFLYELIQNAIDHPNKEFNSQLNIKFEVYNDYLLLKHNGSIFTENNFRSLTGILLGEEDTGDVRIGYKGIGFKSIFRYTQDVYIRSGNFSFSFSKERSGSKMPWEVIPIFENEIDKVEEIKNFEFFNTPVAFAFKFTNPELKEQAIKYLQQLVASPEALLFLDKLARLEVVVGNNATKITRETVKHDSYEKIVLQINEGEKQEWLVCKESSIITDESILGELKDENNPSIPLKFRNFNNPNVQIAFPVEQKKDLINLYAYLPLSESKCNLPFIVNGDFIPNLDRTDLIKNLKYNNSLADIASKALVKLFKIISKEYNIEKALLLVSEFNDLRLDFFKSLNDSFIKSKQELSVIIDKTREVPIKKFVIDRSYIFEIINPEEVKYLDAYKDCYIINSLNLNTEQYLIDKLGIQVFTIQNAIELISKSEIASKYYPQFTNLVLFLFKVSRLKNKLEWFSKLTSIKLVKQNGFNFALKELFINIPKEFEALFKVKLNSIALETDFGNLLATRPRIKDLLLKFGLNEFKLDDTLRQLVSLSDKFRTEGSSPYLNQIWALLYKFKETKDQNGNRLINDRFKVFPINTIDGKVEKLENCFAGDIEDADSTYSFLHETFGKDHLLKANLSEIAKITGVDTKDLIDFLKSIHENVKLTDKTLFKRALKAICTLTKEEFKDRKEDLIKALISVFYFHKKHKEDLFELGMYDFPVISSKNKIAKIANSYFDNRYEHFFKKEELYAEKLFDGVDEIDFISKDYLLEINLTDQKSFIDFLLTYKVSPGLKIFSKSDLKKKNDKYLNVSFYDNSYENYNGGYPKFNTNQEFSLINDLIKIEGKHSNLCIFWKVFSELNNLNLFFDEITCLRSFSFKHPNPFIWLVTKKGKFCPMLDRSVRTFSEAYSPRLDNLLLDDSCKIDRSIANIIQTIIDKIPFKSKLSNSDLIKALQNLRSYSYEIAASIVLDHFSKANFNAEEIVLIKNSCFLIANDKSIQKVSDLVYLDKSLESSSFVLDHSAFPAGKIMYTFDYDANFRMVINQFELPIRGAEHIELRDFEKIENTEIELVKSIIVEYAAKLLPNNDLFKLKESYIKQCTRINLGIKDLPNFLTQVDSYFSKEDNTYYYTELRELTELLGEIYKWPITESRKLRKLIENNNKVNKAKSEKVSKSKNIEFNNEEIEQITKLFGRELDEDKLLEENLFAQVKALRFLKDSGYNTLKAEENFKQNYEDKYLGPIIDPQGKSLKVMCRSARKGILFLGTYAWKNLGEDDTILFILKGDKSTDNIIVKDQYELEQNLDSHFKVIRRINTSVKDIEKLLESETNLKDMQFLYKVKSGEFDIIFNPKQNKPGESEGPLTDIGANI